MNIVIIVIDTLRYDYIAAHDNPQITTPNLDALCEDAWDFSNSYSASYPTIPHRTDAMTGRYGGPFFPWKPLRHDAVTLPWTLAENGYCTQLIHDTPHLVNGGHNFDWPFHAWTFIRGAEVDRPNIDTSDEYLSNWAEDPLFDAVEADPFDKRMCITYARANRDRTDYSEWNCAKLFSAGADWLHRNKSRDNFLLWLDCFDPHEPWDAPREYMLKYDETPRYDGTIDPRSFVGRNNDDLPERAKQRIKHQYAAKVSWVDNWVGHFLGALDQTGLADNTAVLLTADHGTRLYEYGSFGKTHPVREQEAHTPFIVRLPDDDGGHCANIVQPQDIFATVAAVADADVPEEIESYDVVNCAREETAPRNIALCSRAASEAWGNNPEMTLFSVFDGEWALEWKLRPQDCILRKMGDTEDVAAENPDVVETLHAAGLEEIERRNIAPQLLDWLQSGGTGEFPEDCPLWEGYPGPAEFRPYFSRIYTGD